MRRSGLGGAAGSASVPPPSPAAAAPTSAGGRARPSRRVADSLGRIVHLAAWKLRRLEYAWSLVEKEIDSTVRVPWSVRPGSWRRGFLSESWVLYDLRTNDWRDYLSDHSRFVKTRLINRDYAAVLDNKLLFDRFLGRFPRYLPALYGIVSGGAIVPLGGDESEAGVAERLMALLLTQGAVVLKPVTGGGGRGFTLLTMGDDGLRLNGRPIGAADLDRLATECDGCLVSEHVRQHPALARLHAATTNTVRVLTMQDDEDRPFVAAAVLRIGRRRSEPTDNWTRGGLSAGVDLASGRVGRAASYPAGRDRLEWHSAHPDGGAPIEGFTVPHWDRIRAGILEVSRALPVLRYVGWDVVATGDGFRILEGNSYTDVNLLQIHRPLLADERVAAFYRRHGVLGRPGK